jgi:glycosyltransferase involved in cell wall biosynthesis
MRVQLEAAGLAPVRVIHNGVAPREARPALHGTPVIAYAGRLSREKGVGVLLDAMASLVARHPALQLHVIGDGPDRGALEAQVHARALTGHVTFLGHLDRAAMERTLDRAWVQVVPSLWAEPFGNVTTEAMMRGTAVVASEVGGQRDIVRHGIDGLLVPPGDAAALAAAIEPLLRDRERAEALGLAGRARALASFSRGACTDRFVELYQAIRAPGTSPVVAWREAREPA